MYLPKHFDPKSRSETAKLLRENPFMILISGEQISHLPLILEERGDTWVLHGHLARANPHWKNFAQGALVIANGPHAYISASWYKEHDVPTWNYVVSHLRGSIRIWETEEETVSSLKKIVEAMEPGSFYMPDDLRGKVSKAIVAFEITVESFESKFKLGQNRIPEDRLGVISALRAKNNTQSVELSDWMQRYTLPR